VRCSIQKFGFSRIKPIRAALHGSTNFTNSGLSRNKEQLTLSRDWRGEDSIFHIEKFRKEFEELWSGGDEDCVVLPLPAAIESEIVKSYKQLREPDEADVLEIWNKAQGGDFTVDPEHHIPRLNLPSYLVYDTGEFSHQGEAVLAWKESKRRGILEMATGSGKTITSMICATLLQNEVGPILIVVSAPYRPLMEQWRVEIGEFGILPVNLSAVGGRANRSREIRQGARRLRKGLSDAEVFIVSNDTLCTAEFIDEISQFDGAKLLIADECHNLGAAIFTSNPPELFQYRLGLSATPVRQYDSEGTQALIDYFGDICFTFTLEQAIGKCLTEYDYHVHFVELNQAEMELWSELTAKISSQAWKIKSGVSDPYLDNLLRQRRLVLETASDKLVRLQHLLDNQNARDIRYTLIYATDKDPDQLNEVNDILFNQGVMYRQLTYEETNSSEKTNKILKSFQAGEIQILTAKRVLDEGVNIPQIKLAFILASTTVKRQWVQRRGRLLRKCSAIGKTHAVIHDFVVLPPGTSETNSNILDNDAKKLVRSELERVWEFARLSRNGPEDGGPYEAVEHLQNLANEIHLDES